MQNGVQSGRLLTYGRVSTHEQSTVGTSLDGQDAQFTAYQAQIGAKERIDFVEVESGSEKGEERRVEVARLLASVRPGDVVVVTKFDRFTRNLLFGIEKVREIIRRGGRFVSLAEGEFDATPESEFKLAIWAGVAQMEHARIQDRTRGERRRLRSQGKFVEGRPPYGYKRDEGTGREKPRMLEVDPPRAAIIRKMFQLCVEGWSIGRIVGHIRTISDEILFDPSWASRVLRNRIYTGKLPVSPVRPRGHGPSHQLPAEWVDAHEAIITTEIFEKAQEALSERRKHHGAKAKDESSTALWLLRSLLYCGICGSRCTTAGRGRDARTRGDGYYVCRCRLHPQRFYPPRERCANAPYVRRDEADAAITKATKLRLSLLPGLLAKAPVQRPAPNFEKKRAELVASKQRLVEAVAKHVFSMDEIVVKAREIDAQLTALEIQAREHAASTSDDTPENRQQVRAFVEAVSAAWDKLALDDRRVVIAALAGRVSIAADGAVYAAWREPHELPAPVARARAELGDRIKVPVCEEGRRAAPAALPAPKPSVGKQVGRATSERRRVTSGRS